MKYIGLIFLLFSISNNTEAQSSYLEVFEKIGNNLEKATNVVIHASVQVKNQGKIVQSYDAKLEKYGNNFYKKIDDLETYFIKNQYVIIDHEEFAVQYGELRKSKNNNESLGFDGAQIEQLDSLIRNKIISAKLLTDKDNIMVFELSSENNMIKKTVIHVNKKNWNVSKIMMYYVEGNDYFDEVEVSYKTFQLHASYKDLTQNSFFSISKDKIIFNSRLKNYTQTKQDE